MKAKKVTFYFLDYDEINNDKIIYEIENICFPDDRIDPRNITIDEVDICKWNDDHRCNYVSYDLSKEFEA